MGFGAILDMNINRISTRLGFWLVRNFDEEFDKLNISKHQIKLHRTRFMRYLEYQKDLSQLS
ncbi:hypothetical protein Hanom_Chr03g00230441 [Helianthus anomalus]